MIKLTPIIGNDSFFAYVSESLGSGRILAQKLSARLNTFSRLATFLPDTVDMSDPWHGGKMRESSPTTWGFTPGAVIKPTINQDRALADFIVNYVRCAENRICVLENFNARPTSPYVRRLNSRLWFAGDTVLHVIANGDSTEQAERAIREAKSIPSFVGLLANTDLGRSFVTRLDSSHTYSDWERDLERIVDGTDHIIVGAYDGESFLLCSRE